MDKNTFIFSKESKLAANELIKLGLTANYTGFYPAAYAVTLSLRDPTILQSVTKLIYPDVAKFFNTSAANVERNIRTIAKQAWIKRPLTLSEMAGYPLPKAPTNSELLSILTMYLLL